jgi:hypothetical protein
MHKLLEDYLNHIVDETPGSASVTDAEIAVMRENLENAYTSNILLDESETSAALHAVEKFLDLDSLKTPAAPLKSPGIRPNKGDILGRYLAQISFQLSYLPFWRRNEQLREIRQHLNTSIAAEVATGESEIAAINHAIEQFGPAELVGREIAAASVEKVNLYWILGCLLANAMFIQFYLFFLNLYHGVLPPVSKIFYGNTLSATLFGLYLGMIFSWPARRPAKRDLARPVFMGLSSAIYLTAVVFATFIYFRLFSLHALSNSGTIWLYEFAQIFIPIVIATASCWGLNKLHGYDRRHELARQQGMISE